jgi:hypothetical protein
MNFSKSVQMGQITARVDSMELSYSKATMKVVMKFSTSGGSGGRSWGGWYKKDYASDDEE